MSNLVEGNDGNNAYQLLYETFGPIPSREGKNKRLSQELRNQIEHALTMPDIKQSQIATIFWRILMFSKQYIPQTTCRR